MRFSTLRFLPRAAGLSLLAGALLSACTSTQTAFSFRPTVPATTSAPLAQADSTQRLPPAAQPGIVAPAYPPKNALRLLPRAALPSAAASAHSFQLPQLRTLQLRPTRAVARHQARHRPARPAQPAAGRDTLHLVLGALLILGSVAVGLWLGGWLGLGVGAAIMLLGDYFLVLGIGGKHAWQEIFQEFFNM
jgi:hypothetical protein